MRPSAVHAINKITYNVTPSYEGVLWNKVFKECLEWKLRVTRLHANKILLSKLKHKDQGTNEVENFVKRVKNHDTKSKLIMEPDPYIGPGSLITTIDGGRSVLPDIPGTDPTTL